MLFALALAPLSSAQSGTRAESDEEPDTSLILPAQGVGKLDLDKLYNAKPSAPKAKTCYVRAEGGALVAKVMAELDDDQRLVMIPTGELEVVAMSDTRPTDKPFRSATRKQVIAHLKNGEFEDFTFAESGYYIFGYQGSGAFYLHTKSILESLLPGVIAQLREWGLQPQRPATPMVVIIMPNRAAFDALEPMPQGVAAYYNVLKNYVVLYEDTRLWEAAPEYAFRQAAYTVAHEGIHQILANTGIQQRLGKWPSWISEGLPEYFCPLNVSSRLIKTGGDELPERTLRWTRAGMVNDLRMRHLLRSSTRDGGLVRDAVTARQLTAYGYAVSWGLVHYLGSREPAKFAEYLREIGQSQPLRPIVPRDHRGADPIFVKHFGDDYPILEAKVTRHLLSKPIQKEYRDPIENQTIYLITSTLKRGRTFWVVPPQPTFSPDAARKFKNRLHERARAEGREAHVRLIVCDDMDEARYHIRKINAKLQ
ncbi:MAG: DUF1570 domain-containing protein [Planctomycetota bacterium]